MTSRQKVYFYLRLFGLLLAAGVIITVLYWGVLFLIIGHDRFAALFTQQIPWVISLLWLVYLAVILGLTVYILSRLIFTPLRKIIQKTDDLFNKDPLNISERFAASIYRPGTGNSNELLKHYTESHAHIALVLNISRILMSTIDFDELIAAVLRTISSSFENVISCMIHMDSDGYLKVKSQYGFSIDSMRLIRYRPGEGTIGKAYASLSPIVINNTEQEGDGFTAILRKRDKVTSMLFIPLHVENQTLGVLGFGSRTKFYFTPNKIKMFSIVAGYVATAIRNIKVFEQLQIFNRRLEGEVSSTTQELTHTNTRLIKKVRELKVLYDILMAISTRLDIDEVMTALMDKMPDLIDAELFHFFIAEKHTGVLVSSRMLIGQKSIPGGTCRISPDEGGILHDVFSSKKPYLANDLRAADVVSLGVPESYPVHSLICLPVRTQFETVGVFCVGNKVGGQFNQDDLRILLVLVNQLGEVIDNISLYHEKEKSVADLSMLQRISTTISSSPILSVTLKNITHIIAESLHLDYCIFLLYEENVGELVTQVGFHDHGDEELKNARIKVNDHQSRSAKVFREGRVYSSNNSFLVEDPMIISDAIKKPVDGSLMILPLKVENQIIGVLRLGSREENFFTTDHVRLAGLIADQSAIIIENAKLYQRIRDAVRELEQLNKMKNEFIAVISHELRTPITTISGFINILLKEEAGGLNAKQKRFLEISEQSVKRLMEILNDILDVSRIEAGRIALHFAPLSMEDLLKQTTKRYRQECKLRKISLHFRVSHVLPKVNADRERMLEIFKHLIQNAIKFTNQQGSIQISAFDRGDFVQIEFSDTGIGIAEENYDKIFDKFYQVDMSPARRSGGTGLGLSIVRSIIELHGGKIWVESKLGKGSVFKMIMPKSKLKGKKVHAKNIDRR